MEGVVSIWILNSSAKMSKFVNMFDFPCVFICAWLYWYTSVAEISNRMLGSWVRVCWVLACSSPPLPFVSLVGIGKRKLAVKREVAGRGEVKPRKSMPVVPHGEQVKNLALDASAISLGLQPDNPSSS
jgi:hypothetical protein